ncbi:glycoside hydrolase 15-like protein [mine drainage metagenome]|uniref:Glycoside hydrolase 15-like protein n=1 Tax=mine drainage metagenome TaxID=410659 RepID=T0YVT7_9ZZZZ
MSPVQRTGLRSSRRPLRPAPPHPIETYGLIGNNRTALLVSPSGSIDWASFPRFDSPPTFAALLDRQRGGYCSLTLSSPGPRVRNEYLPGTNVLVSYLSSRTGEVAIEDFCPEVESDRVLMSEVHRQIRCLRGRVAAELVFAPRFDYGRTVPEMVETAHGVLARSPSGSIALSFLPGAGPNSAAASTASDSPSTGASSDRS